MEDSISQEDKKQLMKEIIQKWTTKLKEYKSTHELLSVVKTEKEMLTINAYIKQTEDFIKDLKIIYKLF